jgi:hypothetical protein
MKLILIIRPIGIINEPSTTYTNNKDNKSK